MKKQVALLFALSITILLLSCQKSISDFAGTGTGNNSDHTVANLSGTYALKSLTWTYLGTTFNVYDSLPPCEKDDLYTFKTDMSLHISDAGIVCTPPGDGDDTWTLRNDSLFIGAAADGGKIKSFDGTNLVLTGSPASTPGVTAVTTFVKK